MVATVPIGLQICAKVLQMHFTMGGGTPWLQQKSNQTFKKLPLTQLNLFGLGSDSNIFIIVPTVPIGLQTCAKELQMHLPGGEGTPWLRPKNNQTFKKASPYLIKSFPAGFAFKFF